MSNEYQQLEAIQDIRRMMKRSSRFISLSGLSGIAAGIWALIGAWFAYDWITEYYNNYEQAGYTGSEFQSLKYNLLGLALIVLFAALVSAFYFTWRKARQNNHSLWDHSARNLILNMVIPLVTGGLVILAMFQYNEWKFVAPLSLIFYGLALVNASKFTLSEVRYLGIAEIILGLINTQFIGKGLYFWAVGFGVLHIIYGIVMWWKYDRNPNEEIAVKTGRE